MRVKIKNKTFYHYVFYLLFVVNTLAYAQKKTQYNHFMYHAQSYNPAYVGMALQKKLILFYRSQWIGIEGAPKTQTLAYSSPTKMKGLGVGFGLLKDQIGPTSETFFDLDLSYLIRISENSKMAFGLKGSAHLLEVNYSLLTQDLSIGTDPLLLGKADNRWSPNIGMGILFYKTDFYIGLSAPSFLETLYFDRSSLSKSFNKLRIYAMSGFVRELNHHLLLRPSFILKIAVGAPLQLDLAASLIFRNKVSFGISYRLKDALGGLFGYQFSDSFFIGLSYDKSATNLGQYFFNNGSAEVIFRYNLSKVKGVKPPRFLF